MEFVVVTDHVNHKSLLTKANPSPRIAHWRITIMDYKFKIVYKPGNLHRDADEISRHPVYSPKFIKSFQFMPETEIALERSFEFCFKFISHEPISVDQ